MASKPSKLRELEAAGAALRWRVHEDLDALLKKAGLAHMLSAEGCLCIFKDEREFLADHEHLEIIKRFGFRHEVHDGMRTNLPRCMTATLSAMARTTAISWVMKI
ncbi:hypothetical protein [Mesorhizobium denitrificans]|uniref:hypothetical protein n=1 Tax=Mesorhizobium denitrificans TaxID=2294114 RepID=UPI0018F291EE|nr:hypothetical protein [Mesorhizobium denitrificans]